MPKRVVFNLAKYTLDQIKDALLCPVNRDMTRREHSCDDRALWEDGGKKLMDHYLKFGGAEAWAKKRAQYEFVVEEPDIPVDEPQI